MTATRLCGLVGLVLVASVIGGGCHAATSESERAALSSQALAAGSSTISGHFDAQPIAAGTTIWFSAVATIGGASASSVTHLYMSDAHVTFAVGTTQYALKVPPATIRVDPAATVARTTFDAALGRWQTTVPVAYSGNVFFSGVASPVTTALPGGLHPVKWTGRFASDAPGITVSWAWGAALYSSLPADPTALGVKPIGGAKLNPYHNTDLAGTPEKEKAALLSGTGGAAGTRFTGPLTTPASVSPSACPTSYEHLDGYGHTLLDCEPPDTYDVQLALDACSAYATGGLILVDAIVCQPTTCNGVSVVEFDNQACIMWGYDGAAAGYTVEGNLGGPCLCPTASNTPWGQVVGEVDASADSPPADAPDDASDDGASDACAPLQHSTGYGQTYSDCAALGTYSQQLAVEACQAYVSGGQVLPDATVCVPTTCNGDSVVEFDNQACILWTYAGQATGFTAEGPIGGPCVCPTTGNAGWN